MSGRPKTKRGARFFRNCPEEPSSSSSSNVLLAEQENPDANGLIRSWKVILSVVFTLAFLLVGLRNHQWLKEAEFPQKSRQLYAIIAEYGSRLHNYQARLRMPKEHLELLKKESQTLENNFHEILLLIEQIDVLKVVLRDMKDGTHNHSWALHGEAEEDQDSTEVLDEEMSNLVHYVLKKLRGDQVQMADYALKSAGASIIEAGTSETYKNNRAKLYWHGIGFLNYEMPPDIILQDQHHHHYHPFTITTTTTIASTLTTIVSINHHYHCHDSHHHYHHQHHHYRHHHLHYHHYLHHHHQIMTVSTIITTITTHHQHLHCYITTISTILTTTAIIVVTSTISTTTTRTL